MVGDNITGQPVQWLTLRRACEVLGVNQTTLRHWADAGEIRAFRTPGGHRRFAVKDLKTLMERGLRTGRSRDSHKVGEVAIVRLRRRLVRQKTEESTWWRCFDDAGKAHMRQLGRRLLDALTSYFSRSRGRTALRDEMMQIGQEFGQQSLRHGLSAREALQAFIFFRSALEDSIVETIGERNASPEKVTGTCRQFNDLMDQVLLSTIGAYEDASKSPSANSSVYESHWGAVPAGQGSQVS